MALSRKDFFRQSFFSLGETLLKAGGTMQEARQSLNLAPPREAPLSEAVPGEDRVARADNRHCLAKSCGCFSCLERCETRAISLLPGVGIAIDAALCTGCGACRDICPLAPEALALVPRAP